MNMSEYVLLNQDTYSEAQNDAAAAMVLARAALAQGLIDQADMWLDLAEAALKRDAGGLN